MLELINEIGPALIAFVVPFIVGGIRSVIPSIPKALLPVIAGALGPLGDAIVAYLQGIDASPVMAALFGLAGVGVREVFDQVMKSINPPKNIGSFVVVVGLASMFMGCGMFYPNLNADTARKQLALAETEFTVAVNTFTRLRDSGVIRDGSTVEARAQDAIRAGNEALESAHTAIVEGHPDFYTYMTALNRALIQIQTITINQERTSYNGSERIGVADFRHGGGGTGRFDHERAGRTAGRSGGLIQAGRSRGPGFDGRGVAELPPAAPCCGERCAVAVAA